MTPPEGTPGGGRAPVPSPWHGAGSAGDPSLWKLALQSFWCFFGAIWLVGGLLMLVIFTGILLDESEAGTFPPWLLVIPAVFGVAGGVLFFRGLRDVRRWRRLLREGTPWEATVAAVETTRMKVNRQPMWRIRYRYRDVSGVERDGSTGYLTYADVAEWKSGDRAAIRLDPRDGGSVWVGRR